MTPEERVWAYLLKNRQADAAEVAVNTDTTEEFAQSCIDRVSSPNWREEYTPDEGRKDDQGKPRMDLVPPEVVEEIARVLTFGAEKYGERNYERGMAWGRPYAALMRHVLAWWGGEERDPETGFSHLSHAACCLAMLIVYTRRGAGVDDRSEFR